MPLDPSASEISESRAYRDEAHLPTVLNIITHSSGGQTMFKQLKEAAGGSQGFDERKIFALSVLFCGISLTGPPVA